MRISELLPPGDLLKQVEGVESGLEQRYRIGVIGVIATLVQLVFLVANNEWFQMLRDGAWAPLVKQHWLSLLLLAGAMFSLLFAGWARFWLEESRAPFRYTYSIADFKPVIGEKDEGGKEERLSVHLSHDLARRLNERIKRLSLLDDEYVKASAEAQSKLSESKRRSHIHIKGHYIIRQNPDGEWLIDVMPRVRIGPPGSPETLAHEVKFKLPASGGNAESGANPPSLTARQYEQILERVYFSIATEIYKQIQQDVRRKIKLLPNNYYRAVALFHEAEDYASSNTLDAYNEALGLYDEAMKYFDPSLRPSRQSSLPRICQWIYQTGSFYWMHFKRILARSLTRFGRVELMCARAEIGYANMLIYRQSLASIQAQRVNPIFEARPVAERAVERLESLPDDVSGQKGAIFESYMALALAWDRLGSTHRAEECLDKCRRMNPARIEVDAKYLFTAGEVETHRGQKLRLYQRSVELEPRFDVAQYSKSFLMEMEWRTRSSLERNVAELVFYEYRELLKTNPGNVSAWSNIGYMRWLLNDTELAKAAFELGRDYKEIKRETYVAELDYGLARIAAEAGDFEAAFQYFDSGLSALLALGDAYNLYGQTAEFYHYDFIGEPIMRRFERYRRAVEENLSLWDGRGDRDKSFQDVLDELGDAEKRESALKTLIELLKRSERRLTESDKKVVKQWAEIKAGVGQISSFLREGNLESFAGQLTKSFAAKWAGQDDPMYDEAQCFLTHKPFAVLMDRHMPKKRVLDAVYAFVLDDFGNACYRHYTRSGDSDYQDRCRQAYIEATRKKDDYVMAFYHLYQTVEPNEEHIERVIKLAPHWPDGKLAQSKRQVEKLLTDRKEKENKAKSEAMNKRAESENKFAEAKDKFDELERREKELEAKRKIAAKKKPGTRYQPLETTAGSNRQLNIDRYLSEEAYESKNDPSDSSDTNVSGLNVQAEIAALRSGIRSEQESIDSLKILAEGLWSEAEHLRDEAEDAVKRAILLVEKRAAKGISEETKIGKHLEEFLPHKWLWKKNRKTGELELDWKTLSRKKFARELIWQRELNARQSHAFLTWASTQGARESKRLLDHFEKHFWSETFDLLSALRLLPNDSDSVALAREKVMTCACLHDFSFHMLSQHYDGAEANEALNRRIRGVIDTWLQYDPYAVIYWWIDDEVFEDDRTEFCKRLAEVNYLSSHSCKLLGKRLLELNERKLSYRVYQRAAESDDPRVLFELVEAFEKLGRGEDALKIYQRAKQHDVESQEYDPVGVGCSLLAMGLKEAAGEFDAFGKQKRNKSKRWRTDVVSKSLDYITLSDSYRILKDWLEREREMCLRENDDQGAQDARSALLQMTRETYLKVNSFPSGAPASGMYPMVVPIIIEAHNKLVENIEQQRQFLKALGACRDRITSEMGFQIPGISLRANEGDFLTDSYVIMINEVPLALGRVEPEQRFYPRYFETDRGHFNPQTGEHDGRWMDEDEANDAEDAGKASWDHYQYAAYHLEAVLRLDLTSFIGIQETKELVNEWGKQGSEVESRIRSEFTREVLPDTDSLLRFAQVLRGLVKESVPIKNLGAILKSFQESSRGSGLRDDNMLSAIEAARLRLKGELPGNHEDSEFMYLSPGFEKEVECAIVDPNGKRFLAVLPALAQDLLSAFRKEVGQRRQSNLVIVIQTEGIRPFVRRLIEIEFPLVTALSAQELRPDLHQQVSGTIEYP
ncbi:MAG TPA: FHIPEP family type III secretion protein [Blastocatellia bacterium]|nr:FHIPEP family type III secretion protein [Blastocatellia bacterium]